jgi:protein-disulfide reductase (glutathione)
MMRRLSFALLTSLAMITSVDADQASIAKGWNNSAIAWRDYKTGMAEAAKSGKPVFVLVHTTWCPHCKSYQSVFNSKKVVSESANFVMVMVDRDVEETLNDDLGPNGQGFVPRTLFLKSDGKLIADAAGENPEYPNLIDYDSDAELLSVMAKAKAAAK